MAASYQVDDEKNECYYEQKVNEAASHVKAPTQQPENEENRKQRPEHRPPKIGLVWVECDSGSEVVSRVAGFSEISIRSIDSARNFNAEQSL